MLTRKRAASSQSIATRSSTQVSKSGRKSLPGTGCTKSAEPEVKSRRPKRVKIKDTIPDIEDLGSCKNYSSRKKTPIPQNLNKPHPPPPGWKEVYETMKQQRSTFTAPVDTMGCQLVQEGETDPRNRRYATLVALMLSSQTKDEVMYAAATNLRAALGGSISVEAMISSDDKTIAEAISKVGFWRKKTKYLKQAAVRLRDAFNSDVPQTVDELCSLPGVGPKMAILTLHFAWDINDGIGVDIHAHRITNLLGWHKPPTKTPEESRLNLQSWLPKEFFREINHIVVGFGQVVCLPVRPRCEICDLSKKAICPSARPKASTKATVNIPEASHPKIQMKTEVVDSA